MEILRQTFLQWLFKCTLFPDWIRMWNVGFSTGRRTLWERVRTNNKLNPHVTPTLGIKPGAKVEGGEHSLPRSLFTLLYLLETTFSSSCHLLICSIITVCDINFMFDTVWNYEAEPASITFGLQHTHFTDPSPLSLWLVH